MNETNEPIVSKGVGLRADQWDRCDYLSEKYGKKSRNDFMRDAVDFYCAWLEKEPAERMLMPEMESVIGAKIRDSEERIRNIEFKLGVQIAMLTQLLKNHLNYSDEEMDDLRADAVRQMKETNGSFRF